MVKIFRKTRQNLLSENKLSKYTLYAIGEIALVVIGILIALQINNWNEGRKEHQLEQNYLLALKKEYENNLLEVDRVIKLNAENLSNAQELALYTGPGAPQLTDKRFGELFFGTINSEVQYRPGSGVTNEIISSGKLNIFQDQELKNALATLDGLLLRIRFQEKDELAMMRNELMMLGQENVSLRKMAHDAYGELFGLDQGRFLESNLHLLSARSLDNRLTGFIFTAGFLEGRYKVLKEQIKKIIQIIDQQIE